HCARPFPDCNRPQSDFVVAPDDCHLVASLELHYRFLGHEQGPFPDIADETDASKLAGTKNIAWIRKQTSQPNRSRLDIHLTIGGEEFSFSGIGRSVGKD